MHQLSWLFESQNMEVFGGNHVTVGIEGGNLNSCQPELRVGLNWHGCHQRRHKVKQWKLALLSFLSCRVEMSHAEICLNVRHVSRKLNFQGCQICTELTLTIIKNQNKLQRAWESSALHIYIYTVISMDVFSPQTMLSEIICGLLGGYLGVLN